MSKQRSIFEDVGDSPPPPQKPRPVLGDETPRALRLWLWLLFILITALMLLGGLTRLTDSGLSITEWDLVSGILPPMNPAAWEALFAKYQATSEFQLQNSDMSLAEFKTIFWWEWAHRLLGRVIGLVWIIGFLWFYFRKTLRRDGLRSILLAGVLIGLQGVIGIWMVYSGFEGANVDVEPYRLAVHLGMAFIILALIYRNIRFLARSPAELLEARRRGDARRARIGQIIIAICLLQFLLGALTAGVDGGMVYNDWPLMGGEFFSSDSFLLAPIWRNFLENAALVQFLHRMNGYLLFALAIWLFFATWRAHYREWRFAGRHFIIAIILQIVLGVMLLLHQVPIGEAALHLLFAIGIWVLAIGQEFSFRYPRAEKIKAG